MSPITYPSTPPSVVDEVINRDAFPVLIPLRSGWLPPEGGLQAKVGWWENELRVLPPFFRGNGSSFMASFPTLESFFWKHDGISVFNLLPQGQACLPRLLDWIESGVRYGHTNWDAYLISCPGIAMLRAIRSLRPDHDEIQLGISVPSDFGWQHLESLAAARALNLRVVQGDLAQFDARLLDGIRSLGFRILAENVNGPNQFRRALSLGVDGITTRHPEHVLDLIARRNGRVDEAKELDRENTSIERQLRI